MQLPTQRWIHLRTLIAHSSWRTKWSADKIKRTFTCPQASQRDSYSIPARRCSCVSRYIWRRSSTYLIENFRITQTQTESVSETVSPRTCSGLLKREHLLFGKLTECQNTLLDFVQAQRPIAVKVELAQQMFSCKSVHPNTHRESGQCAKDATTTAPLF